MIMSVFRRFLKNPEYAQSNSSLTRGLVGVTSFSVLPDVHPQTTFLLTAFYQLVSITLIICHYTVAKFIVLAVANSFNHHSLVRQVH